MGDSTNGERDDIQTLCTEFRRHLESFYGHLQLAPPYHSIEKAVTHLTALLRSLPVEQRQDLRTDSTKQWALYCRAFVESGLNQKHRGIITGLIRSTHPTDLPDEAKRFLDTFTC